jgi:hypothetical protein
LTSEVILQALEETTSRPGGATDMRHSSGGINDEIHPVTTRAKEVAALIREPV